MVTYGFRQYDLALALSLPLLALSCLSGAAWLLWKQILPWRIVVGAVATQLVTFLPETNIHKAIKVLLEKRLSGAPMVDDAGELVGVLSKKDCLRVVFSTGYHQDRGGTVSEYMSLEVITIDADTDLVSAAEIFLGSNYRRFPVLRESRLSPRSSIWVWIGAVGRRARFVCSTLRLSNNSCPW